MVSYMRAKQIVVNIELEGECSYAARVNFFQLLGIPYEEKFVRRNNVGRFIELSRFTNINLSLTGLPDYVITSIAHSDRSKTN